MTIGDNDNEKYGKLCGYLLFFKLLERKQL